jgi:glucose-1-phosphate adenylyltransferase
MRVHPDGRIREFVEKPKTAALLDALVTPAQLFAEAGMACEGKPYLASMGVYAFNAEVLEDLLLGHPEWIDFGRELIPGALSGHPVYAHMFSGFWEDIGTVRSYFDVSMAMTSPNPPFEFHDPRHQVYTHARPLPGVRIAGAQITNAILCGGSRIARARISDAIIGIRSMVGEGADIQQSIVLGAEFFETETPAGRLPLGIGPNTVIRQAIVDHNARIGANVVIRGSRAMKDADTDHYCVREGIVIVLKNAEIPDGTVIE